MITAYELAATDPNYQECVRIRHEVYVEEQAIPKKDEFDGYDGEALHILLRDKKQSVACSRLRTKGPFIKFERIAVRKEERGKGYGRATVEKMMEIARERYPEYLPYMHAQVYAHGFYRKMGWVPVGETFMEDGILHGLMVLKPPSAEVARWVSQHAECNAAVKEWLRGL